MQRITLSFPFKLHPAQLPAFRAEIATIAGLHNPLFHNHLPDAEDGSPRWDWDYPRVQYRVHRGRPTVTGIGEGAMAILQYVLPHLPPHLVLSGDSYPTTGYQVWQDRIDMVVFDEPQQFGIAQWIALNAQNYQQWKSATGDTTEQHAILHRALCGHLSCMARTLHPSAVNMANEAEIIRIDRTKKIQWHGTALIAFHAWASARILPPTGLGLGRLTAFGFGKVCDTKTYTRLLEGKRHHQEMEVL